MTTTAYSKRFKRELDLAQLKALVEGDRRDRDGNVDMVALRDWCRDDVVCPSCGSVGAQIVVPRADGGRRRRVSQSHFRFVGVDGANGHHPCCEFHDHDHDDGATKQPENLIDFGSERSNDTRLVGDLVCKGIALGLFDQAAIRDMRQWFFDRKLASRFVVTATPESIAWAMALSRHPTWSELSFHPAHGEMPGYDWKKAARRQFTDDNQSLIEKVRRLPWEDVHRRKARDLSNKYKGQEVFDASALQTEYEAAIKLSIFVAVNGPLKFSRGRPDGYRQKGAPEPLLALCALLLFVSKWEINAAISKFAAILVAPRPPDQNLGNVIGLNPFHEYSAWRIVIAAGVVAELSAKGIDYQRQLTEVEQGLRERHRLWKASVGGQPEADWQ